MNRRSFLTNAGVAAGSVATASTLAAPAIAQSRIEMVIVSTWPRDLPGLGTGAQRAAERITQLSEGRINTQYFAADERVGAFDAFDEVASGNAQAYHGANHYWKGKHPAWPYFCAVPFGLTFAEINAWIRFMGGQELWDELGAQFGIKSLMCGNTGVQMGGWFNKEIENPGDLKGLKMRISGLGGDVMAKLGALPVSLPGGQIYENLVSGAIDATEWVGPWNDYFLKLYDVAKYYYHPGMHEPGSMLAMGFNKSWWESLSKTDQALIEHACMSENDVMMAEFNANNGTYLRRLIEEHGVELRAFSEDVYQAFGDASAEVFEEIRSHDDLANRIHESFAKARTEVGSWLNLADVAYLQARNRVLNP